MQKKTPPSSSQDDVQKVIMKYWIVKIKKHAAWIKEATKETASRFWKTIIRKLPFTRSLYFNFLSDENKLQRYPPPPRPIFIYLFYLYTVFI